jgi:transposase
MGRKKLSSRVKNGMKSLLEQGLSSRVIANRLKIGKTSVTRHANSTGIKKRKKKGRPRILSARDESFCVREITSGRSPSAVKVAKSLQTNFEIKVSPDTVARVLKKRGLKSGEKKKKPFLSKKNVKSRLEFAKIHQHWTVEDWKRVIFSDESKINKFNADGRSWCWFSDPAELNSGTVKQTVKFGGGGVMIWGCMTSVGVGYCCKIDSTMDQHLYKSILEDDLMKTIEFYALDESKVIFQHDNDPKHTAKSVKEWLGNQKFQTMSWPAQSPDLNPTEHLWVHVKRSLNKFETPPKGINELWERIQEVWNGIQPEICSNLIASMPNRIQAVLKSKGKWTKY